jgi:hypothetical protein
MLADITEAGRTEQGVGNRVQDYVGIAVPGKAALMGNGNTAQRDRPGAGERVDIETHARARSEPPSQPLLGPREICWRSQLFERRIAFDGSDFHPCRAQDCGFVRRRTIGPQSIGSAQGIELERLRSLNPDDICPVDRFVESAVHLGQSVANRQHRRRSFEEFELRDEAIDHCSRTEGPSRIVNKHGIAGDGRKSSAHGIGALAASFDQITNVEPLKRSGCAFLLSFADDDTRGSHGRMIDQAFDCPAQYGPSAQQSILFGYTAAKALAFTGCDDEGGDGHGGGV